MGFCFVRFSIYVCTQFLHSKISLLFYNKLCCFLSYLITICFIFLQLQKETTLTFNKQKKFTSEVIFFFLVGFYFLTIFFFNFVIHKTRFNWPVGGKGKTKTKRGCNTQFRKQVKKTDFFLWVIIFFYTFSQLEYKKSRVALRYWHENEPFGYTLQM